jgi:hypothetical protein
MTKPAFSKIVLMFVAAIVLACVPKPASARRGGGSHGSGGSHGRSSHGGGSFHSGGHSSFSGGGHSFGGSRGGARMSSARMGGGHVSSGRMSGGSYARPGGFSSRPSGNFARNSTFGGGSFGSSAASRNFGRSGASQPAARGFRSTMGERYSSGYSTGRSMPVSARTSGNAMGGGWHSFGSLSHGGGAEMARGYGSYVRTDGQWHSFGNSRNASFGTNVSGFSSSRANHTTASNTHAPRQGFSSNRFSANMPGSSRFSSFSSFSSGRSMANFGSSRFGNSGFGSSDFGNSAFGSSGFSNSLIGSNVSLIPSLLLGGLLRFGTSVFGGGGIGILGGNALSLAVRSLVSGIGSNGFGQGGFAGGDFGLGRGGFGSGFGFDEAPVWPACGAGASFGRPDWAWSGYCGPYPYYPLGWNGIGYFGDPGTGYNVTDDSSGNPDFNQYHN